MPNQNPPPCDRCGLPTKFLTTVPSYNACGLHYVFHCISCEHRTWEDAPTRDWRLEKLRPSSIHA
jgi:hypothetical protein